MIIMIHRLYHYAILTILITLYAALTLNVYAQNDTLPITRTAEYDIGLKCPVSVTLDPTQTAIWVLMNNCDGLIGDWFFIETLRFKSIVLPAISHRTRTPASNYVPAASTSVRRKAVRSPKQRRLPLPAPRCGCLE